MKFCEPAATVMVAYTPREFLTALRMLLGCDEALVSRKPKETRIPAAVALLIASTSSSGL
jgi:hypothetical protein